MHRLFAATLLLATAILSNSDHPVQTLKDKAFFADPALVAFVRPGLIATITGASIASDGTITANFTVTDPKSLPLDISGVNTPGAVNPRFVAAYIPKGTQNWITLTTRSVASAAAGSNINIPTSETATTTGTLTPNGSAYTYTFKTKAPAGFDMSQTVRIGLFASRNLTEFDLGTNIANSIFTFVPNGSPVTETHDVIATANCNRCHDPLAHHGGARRLVPLCVMCHNPGGNGVQTLDPGTGNSIDMRVMIHKIHMGSSLPSVKAGTAYQFGTPGDTTDYSNVVFPADARNCQMCHEPGPLPRQATVGTAGQSGGPPPSPLHVDKALAVLTGGSVDDDAVTPGPFPGTGDPTAGPRGMTVIPMSAAMDPGQPSEPPPTDQNWWISKPNSAACGACHDNVNFQTGQNHPGGPVSDNQCAQCHFPQGELPFDASILGGHVIPQWTPGLLPGVNFKLLSVTGAAGSPPTVTFSISDNAGNPIAPSQMDSVSLVYAGPTDDYASVVSESAKGATATSSPNTYTYTFKAAVPAGATGTYTMGIEGYKNFTVLPGTVVAQTVRDAGFNQLLPFSVDGSPVAPHPVEHVQQNCNACHYRISAHGGFRQNVQYCLLCHNPNATDAARRPASAAPVQGIDFPVLIHRLHMGANAEQGQMTPFVVYGFNGSPNDFSDVLFPGYLGDCGKCHVNQADDPPVPDTRIGVNNPRAFINPTTPTAAACTACHTSKDASAHAQTMTSPSLGEACGVCHGDGAAFDVDKMHARTL